MSHDGEYTSVNSAGMAEGLSDLATAKDKMDGELNAMRDALLRHLDKPDRAWIGPTRVAFDSCMKNCYQLTDHMLQIVQHMKNTLGNISDNYQWNEQNIQGVWQ